MTKDKPMKMEVSKNKKGEVRYRSKVTKGKRVLIPKDIVEIYKIKDDDVVEWICDDEEKLQIEIKEIVLKDKVKKRKVEKGEKGEKEKGESEIGERFI